MTARLKIAQDMIADLLRDNERLREAMVAAMTAIQNTDFAEAHSLLYVACYGEPAFDEDRG